MMSFSANKSCSGVLMANAKEELRSLLKDVALNGTASIPKRKLLWMLGWQQEREGAWKELLDHWEEIGEKRSTLKGTEVGAFSIIILIHGKDKK